MKVLLLYSLHDLCNYKIVNYCILYVNLWLLFQILTNVPLTMEVVNRNASTRKEVSSVLVMLDFSTMHCITLAKVIGDFLNHYNY